MTTYRLMDGASGRPGVGSSGTQPPSAGSSYSGDYLAGLVFNVSQGGLWFEGYYWWVPATVSQTAAQKFALWQETSSGGGGSGMLVPGSVVTSGTLTAGAWNFVALATPLLLAANIPYIAATGYVSTTGFPLTQRQFGSGDPYASGITNGPLAAYPSGSALTGMAQMPYGTGGSDPSLLMPDINDQDDNLWIDVQVSDTAPSGASYRAWPNMPGVWPTPVNSSDTTGYTLGLEFSLSEPCTLDRIWHYSPSGVAALPTRCLIWNVTSQTAVSGTDNTSPSWLVPGGGAAAAGDGWVYCDYTTSGVTLAASTNYKVSTFHAAGTTWFGATASVYGTGDLQAAGFTQGPLTIPGNAAATSPGQQSWNTTTFGYPATSSAPEADWIDVEVTPKSGTPHTATAALTVTPSFSAVRARGTYRTAALTVAPSFTAGRQRGKYRTGSLTVTPSFDAARARGHYRTGALEVIPVFAAVRIRGHYRSAALTVTPSFSAIPSGGAFAPPVFIYPAYWTAAWVQADTRVTVSPAGAQTATVTSAVLGESAATLYPPGPAVIYPSP